MEIAVTRSLEGLDLLRDSWSDLLDRCSQATIFQTWEWNRTWWEVFGRQEQLLLLQVRENNQLIGLAPLCETRILGTPLRKLAILGNGITDYMDVLTPVDRAAEVWGTLLRHIMGQEDVDMLELRNLCVPAPMWDAIEVMTKTGAESVCWSRYDAEASFVVSLPPTWDEYLGRLDKIVRSNLMRRSRNLMKAFKRVETRVANETDLSEVMSALFDLHERRWSTRQMPGNLNTEKVREFHRRIARRFQERDWLRLHSLRLDGRVVAVQYSFRFRQRCYGYLNGFDPELRRFSLGSFLLAAAIQQAISDGCSDFDLLRGDEAYKSQWLAQRRENSRIVIVQNRLRSQMASWLAQVEQSVGRALSRVKLTMRQSMEARNGEHH